MGNDKLRAMPSLEGYINVEELKLTLLKAFGTGSMSALLLTVLAFLLENISKIYVGPASAIIISIASAIAAMLKARQVGMKYLQEGR
jgi:hypothetical protein